MRKLEPTVTTQKDPPVHAPRKANPRASKNALKHGLLARDTVLPGEDPADFDRQLSALEADIQPANSLEFELVRQIADAQWRMRRLTRLETGFLAAALDETRRYMEKRRPDELRPGYDGETLLLGSAMIGRTQALVHLARYDGHLSRRFFRAVKQLADLRQVERKPRETRSSANSYTAADSYPGRYVPVQAPPPIDTPSPTAGRIGFRASRDSAPQAGLRGGQAPAQQTTPTQTTKQTQSRRTPVESTPFKDEPRSADLAVEIRGLCSAPAPNSSVAHFFVAHALSVPRRDSSRRPGGVQPQTTKQTQSRRTPVESTPSKGEEGLRGRSGTAQGSHDFKIGSDPSSYPLRDGNRYGVSNSVITEAVDSVLMDACRSPQLDGSCWPACWHHPSQLA